MNSHSLIFVMEKVMESGELFLAISVKRMGIWELVVVDLIIFLLTDFFYLGVQLQNW